MLLSLVAVSEALGPRLSTRSTGGVLAFWRVVVIVVGASKRPLKALGAWRVVGGRLSTRSEASVDGESSAQVTGLFEMLLVSVSPSKNLTYNF